MMLRLELPTLGMGAHAGYVRRWHKREGETIAYGEAVCDLEARESEAVSRTKRASQLAHLPFLRGGRQSKRKVQVRLRFQLISSEPAMLYRIFAQEGELAQVGDVLASAVLGESHEGENDFDVNATDGPRMRLVVKVMENTGEDQ
ncbi:MAG: lipoyl domain-containing protein [Acidimicrobiia bacterium]